MTTRLDEIKERLKNATPGPWTVKHFEQESAVVIDDDVCVAGIVTKPNAELIAHAPEDLAWCVTRIEKLEKDEHLYVQRLSAIQMSLVSHGGVNVNVTGQILMASAEAHVNAMKEQLSDVLRMFSDSEDRAQAATAQVNALVETLYLIASPLNKSVEEFPVEARYAVKLAREDLAEVEKG